MIRGSIELDAESGLWFEEDESDLFATRCRTEYAELMAEGRFTRGDVHRDVVACQEAAAEFMARELPAAGERCLARAKAARKALRGFA